MRFGLIAYPKKPIIIAHSGVSRETICLKVVDSLLQLAYFVYARSKSPGKVLRTCRLVGAFATRTNVSCADQFIVSIFSLPTIVLFSYSVI